MGLREVRRRFSRKAVAAVWCCAAMLPGMAQRRQPIEISGWERAERARDAFEAQPESTRTRAEYTRVMDGFRAIYHDAPQDMHAAESVNAVAELLEEEGRGERDPKLLKAAVGQYEFLRTQYPGSSLRVGALLAEGQIEENDLHDASAARARYELLLRQYPGSALAEEARAGLASVDAGGRAQRAGGAVGSRAGSSGALASISAAGAVKLSGNHAEVPAGIAPERTSAVAEDVGSNGAGSPGAAAAPVVKAVVRRSGPLATVTGIRHWSTPSYTRVAIDLGGEVEYEAARVPSPDRIYFDLHGARLAPELVGKSFRVTDDGFLKSIRMAQSSGGMARVVLDVNDVTEYSAFLLPNPYRLIIDIHGAVKAPGTPVASVDAPAKQATSVPNTRAVNGGSGMDVARLSEQPGKVEATSVPTSEPISAVVAGAPAPVRGLEAGTREAGNRTQERGNSRREVDTAAGGGRDAGTGSQLASSRTSGGSVLGGSTPTRGPGSPDVAGAAAPTNSLTPVKHGRKGKALRASDAKVVGDPALPARVAAPTADGQTSLVRALGLKVGRIVIDAGHGGHDSGTLGVDGLEEKDVVLDVALRLGKLLHERMGAEVIYTRSDDTFVPLETRTAMANKAQADLFLSIHANSSSDASARGVETYYLNFTQQADALAVAARENAVSDQSIYQLSDLVKKIALKEKIAESREFATDVEASLYGGLERGNAGLKNRGVKKAPFVVLIGANMPSILAEISFVTNPKDANQLREPAYRERVAESLYKGVARYAGGLGGDRPAAVVGSERASTQ